MKIRLCGMFNGNNSPPKYKVQITCILAIVDQRPAFVNEQNLNASK